jgi:hypothetical protein
VIDYFIRKMLVFISLPVISALGLIYGNLLFISIYCLVLLWAFIKFKSAAVRISTVIAFVVLLVILTQQYYAAKMELAFLPAAEIYYGVISYVISWCVITLLQMVRAQKFSPLQHRAKILYFIFLAIIAFAIYYGYSQITKYVVGKHVHENISHPIAWRQK